MRRWLCLLMVLITIGSAAAQDETVVTLPALALSVGEAETLGAQIDCRAAACSAFALTIQYDPAILQVESARVGPYLGDQVFVVENHIDAASGTVQLDAATLGESATTGDTMLLYLDVVALNPGVSGLNIVELRVADEVGNRLEAIGVDGEITVLAPQTPTTTRTPTISATDYELTVQSQVNQLLAEAEATQHALGTPTPDTLATAVARLTQMQLIAPASTPTSTPTRKPTQTPPPTRTARPSSTPRVVNHEIAFETTRDGNSEIYIMDSTGRNQRNLSNNKAEDYNPIWSSDGQRISFFSNRSGSWDLYMMNSDGSNVRQLTQDAATDWLQDLSSDGDQLVFVSNRDGNWEIYSMSINGTNVRRLTNNRAKDTDPAWSPDGRQIAFSSERNGSPDIFIMNSDGSNPHVIASSGAVDKDPVWSPDGAKIAFESNRTGNFEIYIYDLNRQELLQLTNNSAIDGDPAWSPDGSQIAYYSDRDNGRYEIYVQNLDGSGLQRLTDNYDSIDWAPDWQP